MVFINRVRGLFIVYALAGLCRALVDVTVLLWFGYLIDLSVNEPHQLLNNLPFFVICTLGLIALRPLFAALATLTAEQGIQANFSPLIRWQVYRTLSKQSVSFFTKEHAGNLASKTWQADQSAAEVCNQVFGVVWTNVVFLLSALVFLTSLSFWYFVVMGLWVTVFAILVRIFVPLTRDRARASALLSNQANGDLVDEYANTQALMTYADPKHRYAYFQGSLARFIAAAKKFLRTITDS